MTLDVSAPTGVTWVPTIVTTDQELEGLHTVRAILRGIISSKRIKLRDAQNYCAILLDDNNRKPICRLWFNTPKLRIGLFQGRQETQMSIEHVEDIYNFAEQIRATASSYKSSQE